MVESKKNNNNLTLLVAIVAIVAIVCLTLLFLNTNNQVVINQQAPAGLAAAIYGARYKLKCLVIGQQVGGWAADAHDIRNYPGFEQVSGMDLSKKMSEQVKGLGVEIKLELIKRIEKNGDNFKVTGDEEYIGKK